MRIILYIPSIDRKLVARKHICKSRRRTSEDGLKSTI